MANGSGQAPDSAGQSDSSSVDSGKRRHASDRVLGLLCLALSVWYVLETRNFNLTAFGTGPVGPKTLPPLLGILFALLAIVLIVKPGESPTWGSFAVWVQLGAVALTSFLFGQILEPVGFIISATILSIVVGLFFKGPIVKLAPLSLAFAVVVAFVFNNWLGLNLPAGWWRGF